MNGWVRAILLLSAGMLATGAAAAEPVLPRRVQLVEPAPVRVVLWASPVPTRSASLAARRSWPGFGRACVAGFTPNENGICVRYDAPSVACRIEPAGRICGVRPPDPTPYGLGAALRLDY